MSDPHESEIQNAVMDLAQRFADMSADAVRPRVGDMLKYLEGQGFPSPIATEAALRHAHRD